MAPRTIALVTSSFAPRVGGVEEHVLHVARELDRRGLHPVVWSVAQGDAGTVAEVAARWGFADTRAFARRYRERFGETPQQTLLR